jgi:hypothetical protein
MQVGARPEVISMSMTALTNSWASLEVLKHLESDEFELLDGAKGKEV